MISWGLTLPPGCVLCSDADESHSHLFFECSFAAVVWNRYCGRFLASPPSFVAAVVDLSYQLQGPHGPRVVAVLKLLNQVIINLSLFFAPFLVISCVFHNIVNSKKSSINFNI